MFADVVSSTQMYTSMGDTRAQVCIGGCLTRMSEIVARHEGVVIKTIGDEVMCSFDKMDQALAAGCEMHHVMQAQDGPQGQQLSIRVGLHFGSVIVAGNDLFGDAVNIAARMTGIAQADQIILSEQAYHKLSTGMAAMAREFDRAAVKGKTAEMTIYEAVWEADGLTQMTPAMAAGSVSVATLVLVSNGVRHELVAGGAPFLMGRDKRCNLIIETSVVSRVHVRVEYRRGKFILADQSTNGTWVRTRNGEIVYLRREELPLLGEGEISLGESLAENTSGILTYTCR